MRQTPTLQGKVTIQILGNPFLGASFTVKKKKQQPKQKLGL